MRYSTLLSLRLLCLISIAAVGSGIGAQVTRDETDVVRRAYARLAMATEIGVVEQAYTLNLSGYRKSRASRALRYEITSVTGGSLRDVLTMRYAELVSRPDGDVLSINPATSTFKEGDVEKKEFTASAQWVQGQLVPSEWYNASVGDVLPRTDLPAATRYASARIVVTLGGRSLPYDSLFLFDKQGNAVAIDMVSGSGPVTSFIMKAVYPHVLLETSSRNRPATQAWIDANQIEGCSSTEASECCDLPAMRCGVTREDVRTSAKTVAVPSPISSSGSAPTPLPGDENQGDCTPYSYASLIGPGDVSSDRTYPSVRKP